MLKQPWDQWGYLGMLLLHGVHTMASFQIQLCFILSWDQNSQLSLLKEMYCTILQMKFTEDHSLCCQFIPSKNNLADSPFLVVLHYKRVDQ